MENALLYHHLGLGDHLICNGLVREYYKRYGRMTIFSRPNNYTSVSFMFRDLPNLSILQGDDDFADAFLLRNTFTLGSKRYHPVFKIGFTELVRDSGETFDQQFYRLAHIPFAKKYDSFFVERDPEREKALFDTFSPAPGYIFVHEDPSRNYCIDRSKISGAHPIVQPKRELTDTIFDYGAVIERAKEIHVFDSSFLSLIDLLPYHNPEQKLFLHAYARPGAWTPSLQKNWHIVA